MPSPVVKEAAAPARGSVVTTTGQNQSESRTSMGSAGQVIVMVGLPARGKTYIAKKLTRWEESGLLQQLC